MIKDDYRTETNKDVYAESNGRRGLEEHSIGTYSDDYVRWLESKVKNLTIQNVTNRALLLKIKKLEADKKLLSFMVENGLGEEDMIDDITYPCET